MRGSSPFASLGYFSWREKNAWLIPLRFARVLLPEGEECRGCRREKNVWLILLGQDGVR